MKLFLLKQVVGHSLKGLKIQGDGVRFELLDPRDLLETIEHLRDLRKYVLGKSGETERELYTAGCSFLNWI